MKATRLFALLGFLAVAIFGTSIFGTSQELPYIAGKVTDSKGVPIPGASVSISTASNKIAESLTDLEGSFRFDDIPPDASQIAVEIVGFSKSSKEMTGISAESLKSLAIQLSSLPRPAPPKRTPRLTRQQPQEESAGEMPAFQSAAVTDLPGLNQFQQDLASQGEASPASARTDNLLVISGNSVNLDAGNLNDPAFMRPMMDAARQMGFQIQELGPGGMPGGGAPGGSGGIAFGPAGGGFGGGPAGGPGGGGPGGGVGFVGMGGRGGRGASFQQPKIEGSVTETYGNSALNAQNYALSGQTNPKPVQIQNSFSLTLGGALPFFKSGSGNQRRSPGQGRISQPGWSFSYGGTRNRSAQDILTTVPTDLERQGDFSQTLVQTLSRDPQTGQEIVTIQPVQLFLNPSDPSSRFSKLTSLDPTAHQLLEFIPHANLPCAADAPCVNNYWNGRSLPSSSDQFQGSITGLRLTSKDSVGINYSMRRGSSLNAATFPGLDTTRSTFAQNFGLSGNHNFKTRLISNWRISFNRTRTESTNAFAYQRDVEGDLGMTGVSTDPINWGPPTLTFSNYGSVALGAPSLVRNQTFTISAGLNKIGNKHSPRVGGDINWVQRDTNGDANGRGTYAFTGYATILFDSQGRQVSGTGNDFADFLMSLPYSTSRRYVDLSINPYGSGVYLRNRNWNLYVMDNWRFRSNLTLNYGLRYEYTGPSYEKFNRMVSLDVNSTLTEIAQVFPDQTGPLSGRYFSRSLVNADRNNFAPRVGIAWKPSSKWPFIFRVGYGISYNPSAYSSIAGQLVNQSPFALTQDLVSDRADPLTLLYGFPTNPDITVTNTFAVDPHYKPSYVQQWNFDIQAQLFRIYALNVAYSGSKGTGLDVVRAPNLNSNAGYFTYQSNGADSNYNGLNVQLSRRYSHGFSVTGSYTFSRSIDNSSGGGGSVIQNGADLALERGLSNQDQRHNFQANFTYELPLGQNRAFFAAVSPTVQNIISGWSFNGTWTVASGNPLNPRYASSSGSGTGSALYNSLRPDVTGQPIVLPRDQRSSERFFNTAAFSIPAGQYGDAGRNIIPGPGSSVVSLSMRKGFRLSEGNRRLDLSWQVQNLLNHPNWAGVSTTVNAYNFGRVTSVRSMRSMVFDLRIRF
jgi:hypothetical protein